MPDTVGRQRIDLDGVRLHYRRAGSGDPVVLLHGCPQTSHAWRAVLPRLAERHTVIAPDLRGLGDSSRPGGGYDKRTAGDDIARLADRLGLDRFHLVGHDIGGQVAYALADAHRDRIRTLTLIETSLAGLGLEPALDFSTPGAFVHMALNMTPDLPEALTAGRERLYFSYLTTPYTYDPRAVTEADLDEYTRCYTAPGGMRAYFGYYRNYEKDAADNRAGAAVKLPMPVLAVGGDHSLGGYLHETLVPLCERLSGVVVERCGHYVPEERPDELVAALLDHFPRG